MKEGLILQQIREKLSIEQLNDMQLGVLKASQDTHGDIVLYSPTGSGKTLAYTVPMLKAIGNQTESVQAVVIVPTRELALQIFEILRTIAVGHKVVCCYGGHRTEDEKNSLIVTPSIVVATPGRLLDHCNRGNIDLRNVRVLVIDEFDKALELGFENEMKKLVARMPNLSRQILTSATVIGEMPSFIKLNKPVTLDYLQPRGARSRLKVWQVDSDQRDKLETLRNLLLSLPQGKTIVFANYRESVSRICDFLCSNHIAAGLYHGQLDQQNREMALAMFHNGTYPVLVTTDLASRGLDISEVKNIIHYHMPSTAESYTHRNGRTARVNASGSSFVIVGPDESLPDYVEIDDVWHIPSHTDINSIEAKVATLYFMAGKKEKISRGDIVGFIANNCPDIPAGEIGRIDVRDHYALVAVPRTNIHATLKTLSAAKIKGKRIRISLVDKLT